VLDGSVGRIIKRLRLRGVYFCTGYLRMQGEGLRDTMSIDTAIGHKVLMLLYHLMCGGD